MAAYAVAGRRSWEPGAAGEGPASGYLITRTR